MPEPRYRLRTLLAATFLAALIAAGCGKSGNDGAPNPDLKVPDVPPGRGQQEKSGAAPKEVKPEGKQVKKS